MNRESQERAKVAVPHGRINEESEPVLNLACTKPVHHATSLEIPVVTNELHRVRSTAMPALHYVTPRFLFELAGGEVEMCDGSEMFLWMLMINRRLDVVLFLILIVGFDDAKLAFSDTPSSLSSQTTQEESPTRTMQAISSPRRSFMNIDSVFHTSDSSAVIWRRSIMVLTSRVCGAG